ncbi:MAG: BMP family ABC transporter substrate-binding protein [Anaerolineaceae bacterium]|nr:BMP family ABC transporter substrate-binding protein [Anaerolineaceae bacterium]
MNKKFAWTVIALLMVMVLVLSACQPAATPAAPAEPAESEAPAEPEAPAEEFVFGMLLVGPYNDKGWSQAHYEAGEYVEEKVPGTKMIYLDRVNTADRPGTTAAQLAEELVQQGAKLVIFNSDDMKDDAVEFTKNNPEIFIIHASGDTIWAEGENYQALPNMANLMGEMEYGKMMAGCDSALHTQSGSIGYLGPLINEETRRLAASAFLGARYCWENYLDKDPADLRFRVTWIGFWFNIPGFTEDPTQVANEFINSGVDVIISGIDTTEGLVEARKATSEGKKVFAIPYDFVGACEEAPDVCIGVPYFNWGPSYVRYISNAIQGKWESTFEWMPPYWQDINNVDMTPVGYVSGPAMSEDAKPLLDKFIAELAGGLNLWSGPLNYQDGSKFLAEGEVATDVEIWYLSQLLEGMEGRSE